MGHPFGMCYNRFKCKPDEKKIIELISLAKKENVLFEINSVYHSDPWNLIKICKQKGTKFILGSNAHSLSEIGNIIKILKETK